MQGGFGGKGADKQAYTYIEFKGKLSIKSVLEAFDLHPRVINFPDCLNIIEIGPRAGQDAVIVSYSIAPISVAAGVDPATGTSRPAVDIPAGIQLDGKVTLFPDVDALRFSASLRYIQGDGQFLIDYTQDPISWGCDSSGGGCKFALTSYDHTPANPSGPRFYVNAKWPSLRSSLKAAVVEKATFIAQGAGKAALESAARGRHSHNA